MRPDPFHDILAFLVQSGWPTIIFWTLLLVSLALAGLAWRCFPERRTPRDAGIWLIRLIVGAMWWQQSLWKIPPDYGGLIYWMRNMVDHGSVPLQSELVARVVIPNIWFFGPAVYLVEVAIGASLMLGLLSRLGALLGAAMAVNLWLGLYSAPNEWPWTYGYLIIIQLLFLLDPPGRSLGADAFIRRSVHTPNSGWAVDSLLS